MKWLVLRSSSQTRLSRLAFSGIVAQLVSQMPSSYRSTSSPSNKLVVVFPVKRFDPSTFSGKGKGPVAEPAALLADLNDESSLAFAKMSKAEREKLK